MPKTAKIDADALTSAAAAKVAIQPARKRVPDINQMRLTFYRADNAPGPHRGHLMAELIFLDEQQGVVARADIDTNDPDVLPADEAKTLRTIAKRLRVAALEQLGAEPDPDTETEETEAEKGT